MNDELTNANVWVFIVTIVTMLPYREQSSRCFCEREMYGYWAKLTNKSVDWSKADASAAVEARI